LEENTFWAENRRKYISSLLNGSVIWDQYLHRMVRHVCRICRPLDWWVHFMVELPFNICKMPRWGYFCFCIYICIPENVHHTTKHSINLRRMKYYTHASYQSQRCMYVIECFLLASVERCESQLSTPKEGVGSIGCGYVGAKCMASRVTRWVGKKVAQNVAQLFFGKNEYITVTVQQK
jgi:hypothetical protein